MLVHRCDECGKIQDKINTLKWIRLESGLEFCCWKCLAKYARRRDRQDKEYEKEKEARNDI